MKYEWNVIRIDGIDNGDQLSYWSKVLVNEDKDLSIGAGYCKVEYLTILVNLSPELSRYEMIPECSIGTPFISIFSSDKQADDKWSPTACT